MRTELKELQANFGTTSIYVTHDFMEAMSLGDRIAIINEGKVVQIGTPDDIYYMPCNEFVSQLMGDPEINIVTGTLKKEGNTYKFVMKNIDAAFVLPEDKELMEKLESRVEGNTYKFVMKNIDAAFVLPEDKELMEKLESRVGGDVDMAIRPQNVKYSFEPKDGYMKFKVYSYESIGNKSVIEAYKDKIQFRMIAPNGLTVKIDQDVYIDLQVDHTMFFDTYKDKIQFRMIAPNGLTVKIDQDVYIDLQVDHTMFFDTADKKLIGRYNEAEIRALSAEQGGQ